MAVQIVILAAGKGKRMPSSLPKVLHHLAGKPLLSHVLETAIKISPSIPPIVVNGYHGKTVNGAFSHLSIRWVEQKEQLGTGHALLQALPFITEEQVLVLYGDVPLISINTLKKLIENTPSYAVGLLTAYHTNPFGYGRIKRNQAQQIEKIIEEKDATVDERKINEINPGIYLIPTAYLKRWLPKLETKNIQGEYYLTDIIDFAAKDTIPIYSEKPDQLEEILGVNDRVQLAYLERFYQRSRAEQLMRQGVTLLDPARFDQRGEAELGKDIIIDINVILEGFVIIGNDCKIGANCILKNVTLGNGVEIKPNSIIEGAIIGNDVVIGPYARIRPDTILQEKVHIGNFVEIKNSEIGRESKINHLTYVGDSAIGKKVNIGAGTITCNYDGINKNKTIIEDNAFIGSNTALVAPVKIGKGATIGAGSVITKEAESYKLTLSRADQVTIEGWERPKKKTESE